MTPYKVLYGRKCRFHLCWEIGARQWTGPELMQITLEKVFIIQQRLKTVFFLYRQKSYVDLKKEECIILFRRLSVSESVSYEESSEV